VGIEGIWLFNSKRTYAQYSGHTRAPSVPVEGLYKNHGELPADGWR